MVEQSIKRVGVDAKYIFYDIEQKDVDFYNQVNKVARIAHECIKWITCTLSLLDLIAVYNGASVLSFLGTLTFTVTAIALSSLALKHFLTFDNPGVRAEIRNRMRVEILDYEMFEEPLQKQYWEGDIKYYLQRIARQYGWEKMFLYNIPQKELYLLILRMQAPLLSLNELLELYTTIETEHENAKRKFGDKVGELSLPRIRDILPDIFEGLKAHLGSGDIAALREYLSSFLKKTNIEELFTRGWIAKGEKDYWETVKKIYEDGWQTYLDQTKEPREAYTKAIAPYKKSYEEEERRARKAYDSAEVHTYLRERRLRQLDENTELLATFLESEYRDDLGKEPEREIEHYKIPLELMRKRYEKECKSAYDEVKRLLSDRDSKIRKAKERFQRETKETEIRFEAATRIAKKEFDILFDDLIRDCKRKLLE